MLVMGDRLWIILGPIIPLISLLVYLYFRAFLPWWKRPKFSIKFIAQEPFCRTAIASPIDNTRSLLTDTATRAAYEAYWIRLRVKNTGKSVAKNCIGKLVKIIDEDGQEVKNFDPTQLHWVETDWQDKPFRNVNLIRDDHQYLDTLVTQDGADEVYLTGNQFRWTIYMKRGIINSLPIGKYILVITIYGDDVEPETKYLSLIWGGTGIKDIQVKLHNSLKQASNQLKHRG